MKVFILGLILLLSLNLSFGRDISANNCEVFVDKIVPVKAYFHDRNITYSKIDLYIKLGGVTSSQTKEVVFYSQQRILHGYGESARSWKPMLLEKISNNYFKLSLEVRAENHSISKYSHQSSFTGNFYVELFNGVRIWTPLDGNITFDPPSMGYIPLDVHWVNDGEYDLDTKPKTANYKSGYMKTLNKFGCK